MGKTLLLADDSVTIQKVVGISFASEDVTLITVDNGDDAVAKAREARPDAILADVVMPGMNGYEVCEAIKADPALRHIPVLLLTGTFEAFDEERANRCGAAGHVAKPFEAQALVERVRDLFQQAAQAPPAAPPGPPLATSDAVTPPVHDISNTPSPAEPAASGDSFDFFDDDLADLGGPAEPAQAARATQTLDDDGAFVFGANEAGSPPPALDATPPDHTIAILPDADEPDLAPPPTQLDPALDAPVRLADADDLLGPPQPTPAPSDSFDFDIGPAGEAAPAPPTPGVALGSEDLAGAAVLDPKGSSGFDISTSDLGDPLAAGPMLPEPLAPDAFAVGPEPTPSAVELPPEPPPAPSVPEPPPPPPPAFPDPFDEPVAVAEQAAPPPAPAPFQVPPPPPIEPTYEAVAPMGVRPPNPELESAFAEGAEEPEPVALAEPELPAAAEFADLAEPEDDLGRIASTHDPAALAGVALAEITPRLREELHDTLEKIAWESFGNVTEQMVQQALERVERIAWEVIPQMAETLIREEIRRLKGDSD